VLRNLSTERWIRKEGIRTRWVAFLLLFAFPCLRFVWSYFICPSGSSCSTPFDRLSALRSAAFLLQSRSPLHIPDLKLNSNVFADSSPRGSSETNRFPRPPSTNRAYPKMEVSMLSTGFQEKQSELGWSYKPHPRFNVCDSSAQNSPTNMCHLVVDFFELVFSAHFELCHCLSCLSYLNNPCCLPLLLKL